MTAPLFTQFELDSTPLSSYSSSSSDNDDRSIPQMKSYSSDVDDSPSWRDLESRDLQSPSSPRSIFQDYWSSPTHKTSIEKDDEEDEVFARLQTLQMPLVNIEDEIDDEDHDDRAAAKIFQAPPLKTLVHQKASFDDASFDYQAALSPSIPPKSSRRQILPAVPPSRRQQPGLTSYYGRRAWSSTTALLAKQAHPSIMRKSRYSWTASPGQNGGTRPDLMGEVKKSVSFDSHISVVEFTYQHISQKGWSKYFA